MGYRFKTFLKNTCVYGCSNCGAHLTSRNLLISKHYQGKFGRAYLYKKVINTTDGPKQKRSMTTGVHIVRDIKCCFCGSYLGWRYLVAYSPDQKFKEGKFILEKARVNLLGENEFGIGMFRI